jgi:hydroxymethylbilane synthase
VVGTSSLRREAQVRARFPHLTVRPLRGNVQTRLSKLDQGDYDAIILAASGLMRLGLNDRIRALLEPQDSLPAAGQGALGIEIRTGRDDLAALLAPLEDPDTRACVEAERALSRALGGSCQLPLGAYATLEGEILHLSGLLAHPDGTQVLRADNRAPWQYADTLGQVVAGLLREQGADALIESILQEP